MTNTTNMTNKPLAKGKNHSLFVKTITNPVKNFRIYVNSFTEDTNDIHSIWNTLLDSSPSDTLELRLSSPGGAVTECQMFVNIMKNKFKDRCTTIIDSHASSAGAVVFCTGHKRIVFENSRIMIHNYSGGYVGSFKKMKDRIEFDADHVINFLTSALKIGKKGFLTKKEYKEMINGKEFWFNASQMCSRGIATHVIKDGKELTAKQYLKELKRTK